MPDKDSPEATEIDADAQLVAGGERPSSRVPLDRERIIAAAVAYIDEYGLPGLSMRRLGGILGVEAMALYHHVAGREMLLDGVVEAILAEMAADENVIEQPKAGWQDFLQRLAHGVRRVALAHPRAFPLVASRPAEAPWLRPPLRSLEWVERFLAGLTSEGFGDRAAAASYRAFTSFLLGHLLLEASNLGADVGPIDRLENGDQEDPELTDFPIVRRLGDALSEDHSAAEFEESLEDLLNRLELIRQEM